MLPKLLKSVFVVCVILLCAAMNFACCSEKLPTSEILSSVLNDHPLTKLKGEPVQVEIDIEGFEKQIRDRHEDWLNRMSKSVLASSDVFGRLSNGATKEPYNYRVIVRYALDAEKEGGEVVCDLLVYDVKTSIELFRRKSRPKATHVQGVQNACRSSIEEIVTSCKAEVQKK